MSKLAALAAMLALVAAVPTAAAYDLPLGVTYDLPADLLAFIASTPSSEDFAVGSGKLSKTQQGVAEQFNFSARGTLASANGTVRFNSARFGEGRGEVTCLFVDHNRAGIAGKFPPDKPLDGVFTHFILGVVDNGEPNGSMPDQALLFPSEGDLDAVNCGIGFIDSLGSEAILQGNIVVKDRPPLGGP